MKMRLLALLVASLGFTAVSEAAVTVNVRNFSSASAGTAIVTETGTGVAVGGAFIHSGTFDVGVNFASMSASTVLEFFNPNDATPLPLVSAGLFNGQDFNSTALPAGHVNSPAYILVMNGATIATSTAIAVFSTGVNFTAPDGAGNSAQTLDGVPTAGWVYGTLRPVTGGVVLPNGNPTTISNGIQMVVPEPSAMLLGVLGFAGLIRRRR